MAGITALDRLLREMQPELHGEPYWFVTTAPAAGFDDTAVFATIRETEATTWVVRYPGQAPDADSLARITLTVHSALDAVGLTAAVAQSLAAVDIPANVIAGFYHDHVFVPFAKRDHALAALQALCVTKVS